MPTYATFTQHSTERPSYRNQIRKEIKEIQFGKKEIKLSLFADNSVEYDTLYRQLKKKKPLELIIKSSKFLGNKINI